MRICKGCSQKLPDDAKTCKYCGEDTYEYKTPVKKVKKQTPTFRRCRVCGQLLQLDAEKCKYCSGGTFIDTDPKIKKTSAQMEKENKKSNNDGNTGNTPQYTEQDRAKLFAKAVNMGLKPHARLGAPKLVNMIVAADPSINLKIILAESDLTPAKMTDEEWAENERQHQELQELDPGYERTGVETLDEVRSLVETAKSNAYRADLIKVAQSLELEFDPEISNEDLLTLVESKEQEIADSKKSGNDGNTGNGENS